MPEPISQKSSGSFDTPLPYAKTNPHLSNELRSNNSSRNSSLGKVWSEDYYDSDAVEEPCLEFPPESKTPTQSSLNAGRALRNLEDNGQDHSPKARSHSKSVTELLPFRTSRQTSFSRDLSSSKQDIETEFMPTFTGDKDGVIKVADKSKGLSSWFTGSSTPMSLPFAEKNLPDVPSSTSSRAVSPERSTPQRRSTNMAPAPSPKPQTGMFGGFFSRASAEEPRALPTELIHDELLTLDIKAALFPNDTAADPFSPASFKNLLVNAEGIIQKFQSAYKTQALSLHEMQAENSAMEEELEEAETRTQMLKSQLADMATRKEESDMALANIQAELAEEKRLRQEEREAREKSIAIVRENARTTRLQNQSSEVDEDLGISDAISPGLRGDRQKWRGSADMSTEGESDAESFIADSVFSRSRSPTFTMNSVSTRDSTPEIHQAQFARMVPNTNPPSQRPKQALQQRSTFQKIMQGMTSSAPSPTAYDGLGMGEEGCANCRGKDTSVAWDTVGLLKVENQGLKGRVAQLEDAVDGAMDAVLYWPST